MDDASTDRYLAAVEAGEDPVAGAEVLDDDERATERLFLGLRVREGLHPADVPPIDPLALEDALDAGLVETACGRLRCTDDGLVPARRRRHPPPGVTLRAGG